MNNVLLRAARLGSAMLSRAPTRGDRQPFVDISLFKIIVPFDADAESKP